MIMGDTTLGRYHEERERQVSRLVTEVSRKERAE